MISASSAQKISEVLLYVSGTTGIDVLADIVYDEEAKRNKLVISFVGRNIWVDLGESNDSIDHLEVGKSVILLMETFVKENISLDTYKYIGSLIDPEEASDTATP